MTDKINVFIAQHAMHITDGLVTNANAPFSDILKIWNKGCLELFEWVSQFAILANELCEDENNIKDFPGVFAYEVSCMFGIWLSQYFIDNKQEPTIEMCNKELNDLASKFFSKDLKEKLYSIEIQVTGSEEEVKKCHSELLKKAFEELGLKPSEVSIGPIH
jgi:hypothetical protein